MEGVVDYFGFPNFEDEDRVVHTDLNPLSLNRILSGMTANHTLSMTRQAGACTGSTLEFISCRPVDLI